MTRAEESEELRPRLFAIACRILGSVSEAVDAEDHGLAGLPTLDRVIPEDLLDRLRALTPAQELALLDACERMMVHVRRDGPSPQIGPDSLTHPPEGSPARRAALPVRLKPGLLGRR